MTRTEVIRKYNATEIISACGDLFGGSGMSWNKLTDETADAIAKYIEERRAEDDRHTERTQG